LGGRLDATNVANPLAVAIPAIDFDHQAFLGDTIESIAREKAGVIKQDCLTVLAANPAAVREVVRETCATLSARLVYAPEGVTAAADVRAGVTTLSLVTPAGSHEAVVLGLRGRHQIENAVTAVRFLEELPARTGWPLPAAAIRTALADVEWPARLELRRVGSHEVLIDGAHNPAGARSLAAYLRETYARPIPIVLGVMRDKQIDEMIAALAPAASHFVFTSASDRAAPPDELLAVAAGVAPAVPATSRARPSDALTHAMTLGNPVIVAGSLYLAGEIRAGIP
jgi:dihydrofolate synthase/folylpolyglutamate synthase